MHTITVGTKLYRYEYVVCDPSVIIRRDEYLVTKTTPFGVWVSLIYYNIGTVRFMRVGVKKQFAWPTDEEAKASFIRRKTLYARILRARLSGVEKAIQQIATFKGERF
jgi:hypothetical protein